MSYNIHYGRGLDKKLDLARIAKVISSQNPDLVGLQEIGDHAMAEELGRLTGMKFVFGQSLGRKDGYGDAILCRHPFEWVGNESLPSASSSRYQAMAIDVDLSEVLGESTSVRFINTHFDWLRTIGSQEARLAAVAVIERAFFKDPSRPAILTGDLNATPGSAPLEKLAANGWVLESLGKDLRTYGAANPEKQIDYVLLRNMRAWKVIGVEVLDEPIASDHLPIVMTLELKK
ncbi:MAG: endonuclease/exonuclease/phosphatase family protein [Verrucomicrobiales bacterium]